MPTQLNPITKDLGDHVFISRYLPHHDSASIGPFVFFDHFPSTAFAAGHAIDVRPHPHIGLSTLSYLLQGRMHHRDSLGNSQILNPGDVFLMTSGSGIVHSERTPQDDRTQARHFEMAQFWLALPQEQEQMAPTTQSATAAHIPQWEPQTGLEVRLALGNWLHQQSPVSTYLDAVLVHYLATYSGQLNLPADPRELALFVLKGEVHVSGERYLAPACLKLPVDEALSLHYHANSQFFIFGGSPLDGHRTIWWNLVASQTAYIEAAKARWQAGAFPRVPEDEDEFIPLPSN